MRDKYLKTEHRGQRYFEKRKKPFGKIASLAMVLRQTKKRAALRTFTGTIALLAETRCINEQGLKGGRNFRNLSNHVCTSAKRPDNLKYLRLALEGRGPVSKGEA